MCCLLLCVVACPAPALLLMQLHPPLPPCSLLSFSISCVSLAFSTLSCLAPWLTPLSTLPPPPPPRCRLNILACSKPMTSSAKPKSCDFLTPALPLCLFLPLPLPVLTSCYSRLSAFAGLNLASSIGRLTGSPRHPYTSKQQLHLSWQKYPIQRSYATKKLLQVKKDYHHCARPWTAGKHMESAGQLAKELGLIDEAVDSYRRASELFLHCGKVQPSADVLSRGQWKMRGRKLQSGCTWMLVRCLRKMVANRWPSIITAQQSISTSSSTGLKTRQQCLLDGASQLINVMPLRASAKHTLVQSLFTYMTKI
ncbi:uncharacterized protein [Physcomitrium patens]|uniref:uncharacterized protein isoform X3 n=1 Tax=Physcomitrium patens TaxID=3218 RepID=UPI000D16813F|nr:uncharacterized protein LOC112272672 isoform X3 [Physcomitrium patens]|eukprot:XP_024356427.1 uncharacterized protein LOC112272672 isoform X3 [Physcomitrella patens]